MPEWLTIVLALGGSAVITGIVSWVVHKATKAVDDKAEENKENRRKVQEAENEKKRKEEREQWKQEVREIVRPIGEDIKDIKDRLIADEEATVLNLRIQLKAMRDRKMNGALLDSGDIATWKETYGKYHKMGGNHFAEYVDGWGQDIGISADELRDIRNRNS